MLTGFDPNADVAIAQLAEAAYARNPIPQLAPSAFDVRGGTVYAGDPGQTGLSWGGQSMWMPRVSGSWSMNETVLKAGYGMYYDMLNATNFTPNQTGIQRDDHQRAERGLRTDVAARRPEGGHLADARSVPGAGHRDAIRRRRSATRSASNAALGTAFPGAESQSRACARAAVARERAA